MTSTIADHTIKILWASYELDCMLNRVHPDLSDFGVWCEENGYDLPIKVIGRVDEN